MSKKKKILITGANGYLSQFLLSTLAKDEYEIYGLIHRSSDKIDEKQWNGIYNKFQDVCKEHSNFDIIFHLASVIPYKKENISNWSLVENNIALTYHIAKYYSHSRWVYASSVSIYGQGRNDIIKINSPIIEPNLYGFSKLASEAIVKNLPNYAIVRFSSLIGPGVYTPTFIPLIVQKAKKEGRIIIFGDGSRLQNFLDYRDAASILIQCSKNEENLIGLGCSLQSYSNADIAQMVSQATQAAISYTGEDNSLSYQYDPEDFFEKINFHHRYPIEQTLKEMIDHV